MARINEKQQQNHQMAQTEQGKWLELMKISKQNHQIARAEQGKWLELIKHRQNHHLTAKYIGPQKKGTPKWPDSPSGKRFRCTGAPRAGTTDLFPEYCFQTCPMFPDFSRHKLAVEYAQCTRASGRAGGRRADPRTKISL